MQAIVRHQASSAFLSVGEDRLFVPAVQSEEQLQRVLYHLMKVSSRFNKAIGASNFT